MKRVDERDVIFSRMGYQPGSAQYADYYQKNPEAKAVDDSLRALPEMGQPGTRTFDPINSPIADACFRFLADIRPLAEGKQRDQPVTVAPEVITARLKGLAQYYGAKLVGIAALQEQHYYSHRGRHAEVYGQAVQELHPYGLTFAVEMDREMIYRAPEVSEAIAATKGYVDAAVIGMVLSYYIRELGYAARNHMDGNYLVIAPLVAEAAGLGEIGRNGLLITKQFGPRVRLGVVTTDLPLIPDQPQAFGIKQFCLECGRCARTCPGRAIPAGDPADEAGVKRWRIDANECYKRWRYLGTDCGICLASCPLSGQVAGELLDSLASSAEVRSRLLVEHDQKHGVRPIIREHPEWLK